MITRKANQADIQGILALQALNLASNLSEKQREQGFVTTPFSIPQIEAVLKEEGLFVVEDQREIVAYVFTGTWAYFAQWPIFNYMADRLPQLDFLGKKITVENSFQYGPVCIAQAYRGTGLFPLIFEEMRVSLRKSYPLSMTFINAKNKRSEKAHIEKLGWTVVDRFEFNGNQYLGLAFDMELSVL